MSGLSRYLASLPPEVYIKYMMVSIHAYASCRHDVDAELAKGGGWIYPEGEGTGEQIMTSITSHKYLGGSCISSTKVMTKLFYLLIDTA